MISISCASDIVKMVCLYSGSARQQKLQIHAFLKVFLTTADTSDPLLNENQRTMWAAMTKPVDRRALPPAFMAAAATMLHEQKLNAACRCEIRKLS